MTRPLFRRRPIGVATLIALLIVGGGTIGYEHVTARRGGVQYVTQPVGYADITSTVSETGTVNPVTEVTVGTQVSGTIATLHADYNSRVTQGQMLATLDSTSFQATVAQDMENLAAAQATAAADASTVRQDLASVQADAATLAQQQASLRSAQANATKAAATLALANVTVQRDAELLRQGYIAQSQMDSDRTAVATDESDVAAARAAVEVARAQVAAAAAQLQSARAQVATAQARAAAAQHQAAANAAALRQAEYTLSQTVIRSPVDGVVMARSVSVGQTVAASYSTPTLFTLATNLSDVQVDTSVDEADVGSVKPADRAQITVTAFPNVTFGGTVKQVRVNPTTSNNVVTYDAVVTVHDTSGRLLPGMTAQVTIVTGHRAHALAVPTAALLYRPGGVLSTDTSTTSSQSGARVAGAAGSTVVVWVLRDGRPTPIPVVLGLSDGHNFEITAGGLSAGDAVIVAQRGGKTRAASSVATGGGPPAGPPPSGGPPPGGP